MDALMSGLAVAGGLVIRLLLVVAVVAALFAVMAIVYYPARGVGRAVLRGLGLERAGNVLARHGVFYAPSHLWLKEETGGVVRVGLDDFARRLLPAADVIKMAPEGTVLHKGDPLAQVTVGGRSIAVAAPADGEVLEVNDDVERNPGGVDHPYTGGWLVTMRPVDELYRRLPHEQSAVEWLRAEQDELSHRMERELGVHAADGGEPLVPWKVAIPVERRLAIAESYLSRV